MQTRNQYLSEKITPTTAVPAITPIFTHKFAIVFLSKTAVFLVNHEIWQMPATSWQFGNTNNIYILGLQYFKNIGSRKDAIGGALHCHWCSRKRDTREEADNPL